MVDANTITMGKSFWSLLRWFIEDPVHRRIEFQEMMDDSLMKAFMQLGFFDSFTHFSTEPEECQFVFNRVIDDDMRDMLIKCGKTTLDDEACLLVTKLIEMKQQLEAYASRGVVPCAVRGVPDCLTPIAFVYWHEAQDEFMYDVVQKLNKAGIVEVVRVVAAVPWAFPRITFTCAEYLSEFKSLNPASLWLRTVLANNVDLARRLEPHVANVRDIFLAPNWNFDVLLDLLEAETWMYYHTFVGLTLTELNALIEKFEDDEAEDWFMSLREVCLRRKRGRDVSDIDRVSFKRRKRMIHTSVASSSTTRSLFPE